MKRETNESILKTAIALISERGAWGMSIGDIAESIGVSKGTVHYYYPSKQALVEAAAMRCIKSISESLRSWVEGVTEAASADSVLGGLCDAFLADGFALRVFISVSSSVEAGSELEAAVDEAFSDWSELLEMGALKMRRELSAKLMRIVPAVLPFIAGLSALNADTAYAKDAFLALVMG